MTLSDIRRTDLSTNHKTVNVKRVKNVAKIETKYISKPTAMPMPAATPPTRPPSGTWCIIPMSSPRPSATLRCRRPARRGCGSRRSDRLRRRSSAGPAVPRRAAHQQACGPEIRRLPIVLLQARTMRWPFVGLAAAFTLMMVGGPLMLHGQSRKFKERDRSR